MAAVARLAVCRQRTGESGQNLLRQDNRIHRAFEPRPRFAVECKAGFGSFLFCSAGACFL